VAALSESDIARELVPFEVELSAPVLSQLRCYLELLLRWNERINLTGIRDAKTIVRRLFGESLSIARAVELRGCLVDVGSGAGFPGLALKLVAPELRVTLIEARQKKCAFLKEVARQCGFSGVAVVAERFEDWAAKARLSASLITTRAVVMDSRRLGAMKKLLVPGGKIVLLTTQELSHKIQSEHNEWRWSSFETSPMSKSVILVGRMQ